MDRKCEIGGAKIFDSRFILKLDTQRADKITFSYIVLNILDRRTLYNIMSICLTSEIPKNKHNDQCSRFPLRDCYPDYLDAWKLFSGGFVDICG
jgi:hypothetical protein